MLIEILTHDERRQRRKLMADAVRSGVDVATVARQFKVTRRTVTTACQQNGVNTRANREANSK